MKYLREERKNRVTGATVMLFDTESPENVFDPCGGRWVTYCLTHERLANHETLSNARGFLSTPWAYCEHCGDILISSNDSSTSK
jgi:hypothetical protein